MLFPCNGTENHKFNPSDIFSFLQVESHCPCRLRVKTEEAPHPHPCDHFLSQ